jgi:anti-sigma regulatory factor (Ser/Thr protein kinase)
MGEHDSLLFPGSPTPAAARGFVAECCQRWGTSSNVDAVQLVVSELVTNALHHGTPPIGLRIERTAAALRVEVRDASLRPPRLETADPLSVSGRGLLLVNGVATAWGVRLVIGGKSVWVVIAGDGPGDTLGRADDPTARTPPLSTLRVRATRTAEVERE